MRSLLDYRIRNRYLPFLFFLCYVLGVFFTIPMHDVVSAVSTDYDFGFELTTPGTNITAGYPSGSENIYTSHIDGSWSTSFGTTSSSPRTGTRCFYVNGKRGWFNATYSTSSYLTAFSCYVKMHSYTGENFRITFYNKTLTIAHPLVKMYWTITDGKAGFYNDLGSFVEVDASYSVAYSIWSFQINDSLGDVYYHIDNSYKLGVAMGSSYITDGYRIDRIYIEHETMECYIDDLSWTLSGSYDGGGYSQNELCSICSGNLDSYYYGFYVPGQSVGYPYIECEFQQSFTGTIYRVELPISVEQYNLISSDGDDYICMINGYACSSKTPQPYGTGYVLIFEPVIPVVLSYEKPIFEFISINNITLQNKPIYWWGVGCSNTLTLAWSTFHNSFDYFGDEILNGYMGLDFNIAMCFYYDCNTTEPIAPIPPDDWPDYNDTYADSDTGLFIEWVNPDYTCFEHVGDNPYIMFSVNKDYFTDNCSFYLFQIKRVGVSTALYTGMITISNNIDNYTGMYRILDTSFPIEGYYYMILYNTSDFSSVDSILDVSTTIYVCPSNNNGGNGGGGGSDGSGGYDPNNPGSYGFYSLLAGLGIVVGFAIAPIFIFKRVSNQFFEHNMFLIMVLFGVMGLAVAIYFGLFELWVAFLFSLLFVGYFSLKVYTIVSRS